MTLCSGLSGQEKIVRFAEISAKVRTEQEQPAAWVISNEKERKAILAPAPAPKIDFRRQMMIAISAGLKPTGGFSVRVTKVVEESQQGRPSRIVVHWRVQPPPPGAMVTQALTYPSIVIRLDRRFDAVDFVPNIPRASAER